MFHNQTHRVTIILSYMHKNCDNTAQQRAKMSAKIILYGLHIYSETCRKKRMRAHMVGYGRKRKERKNELGEERKSEMGKERKGKGRK